MFLLTKCGILPTRETTTLEEETKANLTFCLQSANPWEWKKIQENEGSNMNKKRTTTQRSFDKACPPTFCSQIDATSVDALFSCSFGFLSACCQGLLFEFSKTCHLFNGFAFQPCHFCCTRRVWWTAIWVGAAQFRFCLFVALVGPFVTFCGYWALPKQPENYFVVVVAVFTHYWNCLFNQCAFC